MNEIADLEGGLLRERELHSTTKSRVLQLEHELATEREDRRREIVNRATMTTPCPSVDSNASASAEPDTLSAERECAKLTIATLEDQVSI